jgi:hypothetical protein
VYKGSFKIQCERDGGSQTVHLGKASAANKVQIEC